MVLQQKYIESLAIEYGYALGINYQDGWWFVDLLDVDSYEPTGTQFYGLNLELCIESLWRIVHQRGG